MRNLLIQQSHPCIVLLWNYNAYAKTQSGFTIMDTMTQSGFISMDTITEFEIMFYQCF